VRSTTNTSSTKFVSPATRLVAKLVNAIALPSPEMLASKEMKFGDAPPMRVVVRSSRSRR